MERSNDGCPCSCALGTRQVPVLVAQTLISRSRVIDANAQRREQRRFPPVLHADITAPPYAAVFDHEWQS
jgi:hypothetical protein